MPIPYGDPFAQLTAYLSGQQQDFQNLDEANYQPGAPRDPAVQAMRGSSAPMGSRGAAAAMPPEPAAPQSWEEAAGKMLSPFGVKPVSPSPFAPIPESNFTRAHPMLASGLSNALLGLAGMGPTEWSAGANISNVARGLIGIPQMRRQAQMQQMAMPFQQAGLLFGPQEQQAKLEFERAQAEQARAMAHYHMVMPETYEKMWTQRGVGAAEVAAGARLDPQALLNKNPMAYWAMGAQGLIPDVDPTMASMMYSKLFQDQLRLEQTKHPPRPVKPTGPTPAQQAAAVRTWQTRSNANINRDFMLKMPKPGSDEQRAWNAKAQAAGIPREQRGAWIADQIGHHNMQAGQLRDKYLSDPNNQNITPQDFYKAHGWDEKTNSFR